MTVEHYIVWENLEHQDYPSLECSCGRRFISRLAYEDLALHLKAENEAHSTR